MEGDLHEGILLKFEIFKMITQRTFCERIKNLREIEIEIEIEEKNARKSQKSQDCLYYVTSKCQ